MFETTWSKNLQPFILKLMGLVVVLPGWYRYSRGGTKCHRLRYLIFPVWEKKYTFSEFCCNVQKNPQIQWICWMYREKKSDSENFVEKHTISQTSTKVGYIICSCHDLNNHVLLSTKNKTLCILVYMLIRLSVQYIISIQCFLYGSGFNLYVCQFI